MPSLRELQRGFAASVFNPPLSDLAQHIRPGRFPPERHLQVYRNNVFESLTSALKATYPVVERLVGPRFFPLRSGYLYRSSLTHERQPA